MKHSQYISITSQTATAVVDSEKASAVLTIEDDEGQTESRSKISLTNGVYKSHNSM